MAEARWRPSDHCSPRPDWAIPELIVIHCISLPEGEYGGDAPGRLFTGTLNIGEHPTFADLEGVRVSAHLLIHRSGQLDQFVAFNHQAWHAGESSWCGRGNCNPYSLGIEMEGTVADSYTSEQYECLAKVVPPISIPSE